MEKLIEMCSLNSVSGNEFKMTNYIKEYTKTFCDNVVSDEMGNVIAFLNNNSDVNIALEAHIDNIGLVVKEIDDKGFIKFICSGAIDSSILPTAEVIVHGKKELFGVIGAKPPHLQSKDDIGKKNSVEDMYIDCGYNFPLQSISCKSINSTKRNSSQSTVCMILFSLCRYANTILESYFHLPENANE